MRATIHLFLCVESPFDQLGILVAPLILAVLSLLMLCVVDFSCPACFFLLHYVVVLIFWLLFDCIRRPGGVFTRVSVARMSFLCAVRVFHVLLRLCCVSLVPFVIFDILLPFASLDDYSQSVWTGLLVWPR